MKDDWQKHRSHGKHLTFSEVKYLKLAFRDGVKPKDAARKLKCSSRAVEKRFQMFRAEGLIQDAAKIIHRPLAENRFYKPHFEL